MHKLYMIILAGFLAGTAHAQSFVKIDSATYAQYLAGDWSTLIREGKEAIRQDVDYYYLRMRVGIAFFEQKNYRAAMGHFKKALEFNQDDPVAMEYLYFCYLYSGQSGRAAVYRDGFTRRLAETLPPEEAKFINTITAEYLYISAFNDDYVTGAEDYFASLTSGSQVLTRHYHNASFGMSHTIRPGLTLSHAYTYLAKSNFMYYHDGLTVTTVDGQRVSQHQYFLYPAISTSSGFTISPSLHILGIGYQVITDGGTGFGSGSGVGLVVQRTSAIVGGLAMSQVAGPVSISLGGNYSNLNDREQLLVRGGVTWFPKGNLDLYLGGYLNTQKDISENAGSVNMIPEYLLGAGIASRIWVEVFGSHGEMANYVEGNGYIVYNGLDMMKHKISMNLVYPVTKKGSKIYLGARWLQYQSTFIPFDPGTENIINPLEYSSLSVFGGIVLKL